MKKLLLSLIIIAALVTPASVQAQGSQVGACAYSAGSLVSAYKEMLTVTNAAKLLTAATYAPTNGRPRAVCALIVVNTNSISWWSNGEVPTASDGIITLAAGSISIGSIDLPRFQMIRAGASDAAVAVLYFTPVQ